MSTDVLSVRLPAELKSRLDRLSAETGRPSAFYVREALAEHLDEMEWAYRVAGEAEGIRAGRIPAVPLERAVADLGITQAELDAAPDDLPRSDA